MQKTYSLLIFGLILFFFSFTSCVDDVPPALENEEEIITDVKLIFTPQAGGTPIEALAQDPDGEGPENISIVKDIILQANTAYDLSIYLENTVAGQSITEEVEKESDEHLFLFEWTQDLFDSPQGNGNLDERADPMNYLDEDINGLPVGLTTHWESGKTSEGNFHIVLKHQPGVKSAVSGVEDGESDVDLTWGITIQ